MKISKFILPVFLSILCFNAVSQVSIGLTTGPNLNLLSIKPHDKNVDLQQSNFGFWGWGVGLVAEAPISDKLKVSNNLQYSYSLYFENEKVEQSRSDLLLPITLVYEVSSSVSLSLGGHLAFRIGEFTKKDGMLIPVKGSLEKNMNYGISIGTKFKLKENLYLSGNLHRGLRILLSNPNLANGSDIYGHSCRLNLIFYFK